MHLSRRNFSAMVLIAVSVLGMIVIVNPVQAHFTLGALTGTYRFHANDFDPHVPGVIGYVWPGGGQNAYAGLPNVASATLSPGYQSPYPCTLGGQTPPNQCNPPGAPSSSWYQLQGNAYAPFGAILSGSTGDLIFAINATTTGSPAWTKGWGGLQILIPPGFGIPGVEQVVSTISNNYANIYVDKLSPYDRYAPGWTLITVLGDAGCTAAGFTTACGRGNAFPSFFTHQWINFTSAREWYYVRINGVTAPSIAGRYFFKILLYGDNDILGQANTGENTTQFVPTQNWPVLLVKGEIDPAIITGTIRYGGYNSTLYGMPIGEAGMVLAKMKVRLDPYTGEQRPDLPTVNAQSYFNATANGHYEVEGLAAGVYDIYAEAAGFPQTLIQSSVTVLKGQSLHFDGYLQPGPVIHGNVFTKHQFGDEPWPEAAYIKIEFYDGPTLNHRPDSSAHVISWSPLPCVAGGQDLFYGRRHAGLCGDPRIGGFIAFPWHEYTPANGYGNTAVPFFQVSISGQPHFGLNTATLSAMKMQDPEGVGPPQHWFVTGGTTTPFHFEFGVKGEYGAPRDLSGMVPQVFATWINGLTPGRYWTRAWVFRYVQSALDGSTFQEYYFDITPQEWAGDVTLPIDLRLSSWVNKTVHFHNQLGGLTEDPIDTGGGFMAGYLLGADGHIYSYNQSALAFTIGGASFYPAGNGKGNFPSATTANPFTRSSTGTLTGGIASNTCYGGTTTNANTAGYTTSRALCGVDLDKARLNTMAINTGRANIQFWGINDTWGGENYGIPSGIYTPYTFVLGYIDQQPLEQVSVTLSGTPTSISDHMYRGAGFNVTLYSIDWERPTVNRSWEFGNPVGINAGTKKAVGLEINVGIYQNGTIQGWMSDESNDQTGALPSTINTNSLYQSLTENNVSATGGGWDPINSQGVVFPQDANNAYFGQELKRQGYVGGYGSGREVFNKVNQLWADNLWIVPGALYQEIPTAFSGGQYDLRGYTYGYIQDQPFSVYVQQTQVADVRINLVIGVNVTLDVLIKKEHVITGTATNMSSRIRLFDDSGNLVAEWMSSEGTYVTQSGFSRAADGTTQFPFGPLHALTAKSNEYNYIPGDTTLLHVLMAGLPQVPATFIDSPDGDNTKTGMYFSDPIIPATRSQCSFALECYKNPGISWNAPGFFPNTGILGSPDYQGGWTAEADFVNWYNNNTMTGNPNYFPPVNGLLEGESYHIIPGTTATSAISLTEDLALSAWGAGHSMVANHLGPYSQEGVWQISGTHLSGEASGIFEVDLNGFISGTALAFTWANDFRPLSWATVSVTAASGASWNYYTYDGQYQMFLVPGTYSLTISSPGHASQSLSVAVTDGESSTVGNVYMQQSNIPVPEFTNIALITFTVLAATLHILHRKRRHQ